MTTPETLAEAILEAAGSSLLNYRARTRAAILAAAEAQIATIVQITVLNIDADPRNIAQDDINAAVRSTTSQTVDNGPHGAENGEAE